MDPVFRKWRSELLGNLNLNEMLSEFSITKFKFSREENRRERGGGDWCTFVLPLEPPILMNLRKYRAIQ